MGKRRKYSNSDLRDVLVPPEQRKMWSSEESMLAVAALGMIVVLSGLSVSNVFIIGVGVAIVVGGLVSFMAVWRSSTRSTRRTNKAIKQANRLARQRAKRSKQQQAQPESQARILTFTESYDVDRPRRRD